MNINNKKLLSLIFGISTATAFLTPPNAQAATGEPTYKDAREANSKLEQYCDTYNFKTMDDHAKCLQETSGQTMTFAETFYAGLFIKEKIIPSAEYYKEMVQAWEKEIQLKSLPTAKDDITIIKEYPKICYDRMQDNLASPKEALSFSYTTGYSIPKFCLDTALDFSEKYQISINTEEAKRLQSHLKNIYNFYTENPIIPEDSKQERSIDQFNPNNNLKQRGETRDFWV